jgi:hypothetical protein
MRQSRMLNKIIEFVVLTLVVFLCSALARATTVTGTTVSSGDGQLLTNARITAEFVPKQGTFGSPIIPSVSATTDTNGSFTMTLTDVKTISPSGGTWKFTVCPNATVPCTIISGVTITGTTQEIGGLITSNIPSLAVNAQTLIPKAYNNNQVPVIDLTNTGAMYWNTIDKAIHLWDGSVWTGLPSLSGNNIFTGNNTVSALCNLGYMRNAVTCDGVIGDGTTDNTTKLNTSLSFGRDVILPRGNYLISGQLNITTSGQHILCEDQQNTFIISNSLTANGLVFTPPNGGFFNRNGVVNCTFTNTNGISATGWAIIFGGSSASHNGDWCQLENVKINGWGGGVQNSSWSQCSFIGGFWQNFGDRGYWQHGSVNDTHVFGTSVSAATNECVHIDTGGQGNVLEFGDLGDGCTNAIHVGTSVSATIIGSEIELTTSNAFQIDTGSMVNIIGSRILKGTTGGDVSQINIASSANLKYDNICRSGYTTTIPLITQTGSAHVWKGSDCQQGNQSATDGSSLSTDATTTETWRSTHQPAILDNSIPTANAQTRLWEAPVVGRLGIANDSRKIVLRDSAGNYAVFDFMFMDSTGNIRPSTGNLLSNFAGTFNIGTSVNQSAKLFTNNTARWIWTGTGDYLAQTDNANNIGAAGSSRPANIFAATGFNAGNGASQMLATGALSVNTALLKAAACTASASQICLGGTTATTVGAAGAAATLPATPVGYIIVNVGGTIMKIPYYNN